MSESGQEASLLTEDPRIERTRRAVREATLEVLAETGYAEFTMEKVATEARVARSTLYRHWPSRIALIADALDGLNQQPMMAAGEGSARDRAEQLLVHLVQMFSSSSIAACMPGLVEAAEHNAEVAAFLHAYSAQRRQALTDALAEGVSSGELPTSLHPDLAARALAGAVMYSRFMTPEPLGADHVADLLSTLFGPPP